MPVSEKIIVANWKENLGFAEGLAFLTQFLDRLRLTPLSKTVVVCPAYPFLPSFKEKIATAGMTAPVRLGSQDVSRFESGPHTGEVSARLLAELAEFALVGHSERRGGFGESVEVINAKVALCQKHQLIPIVCVSDFSQLEQLIFHQGQPFYLAYEPLFAIGSGQAAAVEAVERFLSQARAQLGDQVRLLYGGSVDLVSLPHFSRSQLIQGFLVGTASLQMEEFFGLLKKL